MILGKTDKKWKDILKGKIVLPTDNLGLQMFLKRSTSRFTTERPAEELEKAVLELHAFFVKYERILQKELAAIAK